jgi:hypothetical protein
MVNFVPLQLSVNHGDKLIAFGSGESHCRPRAKIKLAVGIAPTIPYLVEYAIEASVLFLGNANSPWRFLLGYRQTAKRD